MSLADKSLVELHEGLLQNKFTSVDIVNDIYNRIADRDDSVQSFITLTKDVALKQAEEADRLGYSDDQPLRGIPVGIKDNIVTKDILTTAASHILDNFVPIYDATAVEKLKAAGAVIIGKLNMDEFAMGGSTETSYFKKTTNAWDHERVPGGSSGGSAAAVAASLVPVTLGTDTGGSIRQPAAFNGVVGMKPTYGRVSRYGLIAFASSLDQIGPLTRSVADNALVLSAISGVDAHDSTSVDKEIPNYYRDLKDKVDGLTIGVPKEYLGEGIDDEVKDNVRDVIKTFEKLGATVKEISLPHSRYGINAYYVIASSEASSNLQRFDGIRYGFRAKDAKDLTDLYVKTRSEGFGSEVKRRIMLGTFSLSSGYYDAYFKKAAQTRTLIKQDFAKAFEEVDVILGPVSTSVAFKLGEKFNDPIKMYMADLLTIPINLAGLPSLAIPSGLNKDDLPFGVQLIGNYFDEQTLYNVGQAYENETGFENLRPTFEEELS